MGCEEIGQIGVEVVKCVNRDMDGKHFKLGTVTLNKASEAKVNVDISEELTDIRGFEKKQPFLISVSYKIYL